MANLERYIQAQERDYQEALTEIKNGAKEGHWIWYIFPQVAGLGLSSTSRYYAIEDLEEAKAYLQNDVLRQRLLEISNALLSVTAKNAEEILGYTDALKVRSSMTLFHRADPSCELFSQVLEKYYGGEEDWNTLSILHLET